MGRLSPHGGKRQTFQAPKESSREGQTEGQDGGLITSASYSTCSQVNNISLLPRIISSVHRIVWSEVTLNMTTNDTRVILSHSGPNMNKSMQQRQRFCGAFSLNSFRQSCDTRRCQNTLTTISNVSAIFFIQSSWSSVQYFADFI